MKYRPLGTTNLQISEVGFGVWTVATNWWGKIDEGDGVKLLVKALDRGVNFFDTSDAYGDGYGEEILAKALNTQRHNIVIGTKFGYDIDSSVVREGHQERPQSFAPDFIRSACEKSLRRLRTDYIDLYQLHNPRIDVIHEDETFAALDELVKEGKVRYYGVALGPDIGWFEEGEASMRLRKTPSLQIIYSILEQEPAKRFFPIAEEEQTGLVTRVPHASGLLDGTYSRDTVIEATDHRSHRRKEWLEDGLKKVERLDFLIDALRSTIGQMAIQYALAAPMVASVLPNITNLPQLEEFAAAPETEEIPPELIDRLSQLYDDVFALEDAPEASTAS
jgi:aryl-alcohol dehydrogenase-like predicted oxidoreductase